MITYEDFAKFDLRVAKILSAERVEGSEKLIKLQLDVGDPPAGGLGERQIVAGIGTAYQPEALVGKLITIIANLEPRKLMGHESNGMLLAADSESGPIILIPEKESQPGAKI